MGVPHQIFGNQVKPAVKRKMLKRSKMNEKRVNWINKKKDLVRKISINGQQRFTKGKQ